MAITHKPLCEEIATSLKALAMTIKLKKQRTMKYTAPEFGVFEVAVEGGYGNSTLLPGFGSEEDELTY